MELRIVEQPNGFDIQHLEGGVWMHVAWFATLAKATAAAEDLDGRGLAVAAADRVVWTNE